VIGSSGIPYILDTSCLTQAFRVYYPFDIAPSFWDFFKNRITGGDFIIIDKVYDEISRGNDDLKTWLQSEIPGSVILDCNGNPRILSNYGALMKWANGHASYNTRAKSDFAEYDNADPWNVAVAIESNAFIVSQEVSAPGSQKNIKLPDVCSQFNVQHIDTFMLLRAVGFKM
jgi:hypothetical protein